MTPKIASAHHRAATAFNDVVAAARIAIEALAEIAAQPGRAIEIVESSLTAIEAILHPSELTQRSFLKAASKPASPTTPICDHNGSRTGQRA